MKKRLQNILAHAGCASRRGAATLIESGLVTVDGEKVTEKGLSVDPEKSTILVEGKPIKKEEKKHYFLLNKPQGIISTAQDTHGRRIITDFFSKIDARLYPVGRLDKDTTGLIIITNDGELANRLSHPRYEVEKEYKVEARGALSASDIKKMERGIDLEGKKTAPCEVRTLERLEKSTKYVVTLHEGRKRQIKKMFEEMGSRVSSLKRVKYAFFKIGGLKQGEFRKLTDKEVEKLKSLVKL